MAGERGGIPKHQRSIEKDQEMIWILYIVPTYREFSFSLYSLVLSVFIQFSSECLIDGELFVSNTVDIQSAQDLQHLRQKTERTASNRRGRIRLRPLSWRCRLQEEVCIEKIDLPNRWTEGQLPPWGWNNETAVFLQTHNRIPWIPLDYKRWLHLGLHSDGIGE